MEKHAFCWLRWSIKVWISVSLAIWRVSCCFLVLCIHCSMEFLPCWYWDNCSFCLSSSNILRQEEEEMEECFIAVTNNNKCFNVTRYPYNTWYQSAFGCGANDRTAGSQVQSTWTNLYHICGKTQKFGCCSAPPWPGQTPWKSAAPVFVPIHFSCSLIKDSHSKVIDNLGCYNKKVQMFVFLR